MVSIASFAVKSMADALINTINDGISASPTVSIYAGTRPASPEDPITDQVLLVELALNANPFTLASETSSEVVYSAGNISPVLALADDDASFFRIVSAEGVSILDGSVSDSSGTGEMKISLIQVVQGWLVKVLSLTFKMSKI